jgi:DNA-binding transcriptional regulator YdaS (Cro superfamily)
MTVSELVAELGGYRAVAQLLGVVPSAVSNWKKSNRVPPRLYLPLLRECERRKMALPPDHLFQSAAEPERRAS